MLLKLALHQVKSSIVDYKNVQQAFSIILFKI